MQGDKPITKPQKNNTMSNSHSEVAHNFAHQTGNSKNGFNIFYETNENGSSTIYSYGHHFGVSHILEPNKYGLNVCLFTEADYSVSTSKHKSIISSALSHFDKIYVPNEVGCYIDFNGNIEVSYYQIEKDINHYNNQLNKYIGKHFRARKYSYLDDILSTIEDAKKYAELFNCKHRLNGKIRKAIYNDIDTESGVLEYFFSDSEVQKIKDKRQAQKERKDKRIKKAVQMFRDGKVGFVREDTNYTYLRVNTEDDVIQTSKGINLPIKDAKLVWAALKIAKDQDKDIQRHCTVSATNGSAWEINTITPKYIKAGCHTVTYREAKRIAEKLNWV